jgi:hypothetical protein
MMRKQVTLDRIEGSFFQDMYQLDMLLDCLFHLMDSSFVQGMQMGSYGFGIGRQLRIIGLSKVIMGYVLM